jgi:hypothetical protein
MAYFFQVILHCDTWFDLRGSGIIRTRDRDLVHPGEDVIVVSYRGFRSMGLGLNPLSVR